MQLKKITCENRTYSECHLTVLYYLSNVLTQLNRRGLKPVAFFVVYNSDSMLSVVFLTNLLSVLQSVIFLECF